MTSDRIKQIQESTAYPESLSVKQALLQVWNECEQEKMYSRDDMFVFAGFVQGKHYSNPEMDLTDIMEEFEITLKNK